MLASYFQQGGPLMYALLVAWVIVLAGAIDRALFAVSRAFRRPAAGVRRLARAGDRDAAVARASDERRAARAGLARLDAVSQLATSIGLFGTVLGIAQGFLARGAEADASARLEALASGLSTALFTTIAGLGVYLFGQAVLIVYREWLGASERAIERALGGGVMTAIDPGTDSDIDSGLREDAAHGQLGQSALTPLLDVLFLLLFALLATAERDALVGSTEIEATEEISVQLPEVAPDAIDAAGAPDAELLRIVVDAQGTVRMARASEDLVEIPTTSALIEALAGARTAAGAGGEVAVEVRADADTRHAVVVDVLQTLWASGVSDVRFIAAIDREAGESRAFGGEVR